MVYWGWDIKYSITISSSIIVINELMGGCRFEI